MKTLREFTFDHICILGGEPLDQDEDELNQLLWALKHNFPDKPLWLYTHFEIEEVDKVFLSKLDYLKTGEYKSERKPAPEYYGVFLASDNQKIHKLN
jgi:organic radical activating enzyme